MEDMERKLPFFLAMITTVGFFSFIYLIIFRPVPEESRDIVFTMLGSIGTAWISIVAFHFGSSAIESTRATKMAERLERESIQKVTNGHSK